MLNRSEHMNILLTPASYAPKVGGLETAVAHLGAELARRGHTVTVVTNRYPRTLPAYEQIGGISVHRILMPNIAPGLAQLPRLPKYLLGLALAPLQLARLARLVGELRPDIVNAHYLGVPALYARLASRLRPPARLVVSVHGSDLNSDPLPTGGASLSRYVVAGARAATACSQSQADCLRALMGAGWPRQAFVTGNGVASDELAGARAFQHPRPYLLAAARLSPVKGIDVLIRALRLARDAGHDVDLILAGAGPEELALRQLARDCGVEQSVRFWGSASRAELAGLLHGCVLLAQPSRAEGFGIAALEAMVCGRAVVASRAGGLPELVRDGETGLLVPPDDPAALSAAIAALLSEPARRADLGRRGRERALSEFTWSAVAGRYLNAYAAALE